MNNTNQLISKILDNKMFILTFLLSPALIYVLYCLLMLIGSAILMPMGFKGIIISCMVTLLIIFPLYCYLFGKYIKKTITKSPGEIILIIITNLIYIFSVSLLFNHFGY